MNKILATVVAPYYDSNTYVATYTYPKDCKVVIKKTYEHVANYNHHLQKHISVSGILCTLQK